MGILISVAGYFADMLVNKGYITITKVRSQLNFNSENGFMCKKYNFLDKKIVRKWCSSCTNYLHDACWFSPRSGVECGFYYNWSWFGRLCVFRLFVSFCFLNNLQNRKVI